MNMGDSQVDTTGTLLRKRVVFQIFCLLERGGVLLSVSGRSEKSARHPLTAAGLSSSSHHKWPDLVGYPAPERYEKYLLVRPKWWSVRNGV